jgi:DNA-binding LacI/PurR family transcriptional regulator
VPENTGLEDSLYQLYCKNIKNAVVWPDDKQIDAGKLLRLRSIGMNLVFFDTDDAYPYADCVFLDNEDAVQTLVQSQKNRYDRYLYIGWDELSIVNVRKREEAFRKLCPGQPVLRMAWRRDRRIEEDGFRIIQKALDAMEQGLVVCSAAEIGQQTAEIMKNMGVEERISLAAVDNFEGADNYPISIYDQDLEGTADRIYAQLEAQIHDNRKWKAKNWAIKGKYIIYNGKQGW